MHPVWMALALVPVLACADEKPPDPGAAAACRAAGAPARAACLQAWLVTGGYRAFAAEAAVHASAGPHRDVRVFVNDALAASFAAGDRAHPVGSAAIKELHDGGLIGWAVMVKTRPEPGAASWYWYEVAGTGGDDAAWTQGQDDRACTGCHQDGVDGVQTAWPLR